MASKNILQLSCVHVFSHLNNPIIEKNLFPPKWSNKIQTNKALMEKEQRAVYRFHNTAECMHQTHLNILGSGSSSSTTAIHLCNNNIVYKCTKVFHSLLKPEIVRLYLKYIQLCNSTT